MKLNRLRESMLCGNHWHVQKDDVEREVIPPLNSLLLMFQGPSNIIRKRYHKLLDYENADNRLGSLKDGELITTVSRLLSSATH